MARKATQEKTLRSIYAADEDVRAAFAASSETCVGFQAAVPSCCAVAVVAVAVTAAVAATEEKARLELCSVFALPLYALARPEPKPHECITNSISNL